jgi:hypothetical protein
VHALPGDTYRIENLGIGQLRFNASILECGDRIAWDRTIPDFFADFAPLCIEHYRRVKERADRRIEAMEAFVESGYDRITLK